MATAAPITPDSLAQRTASINDAIARVSSAANAYAETSKERLEEGANSSSSSKATHEAAAQESLAVEVRKLLAEVQGPAGVMFDLLGSLCRATALRCLLDMGVFGALPADGTPMSADVLLSRLAPVGDDPDNDVVVEKELLVRLMRNATTPGAGPLVEVGWKVPTEPTNCPYTFAHRTEGRDCWSHIARFPERQANCNDAMKAQSFDGAWAVGLYPFAERLQRSGGDEKTPLVVDVGGGAGHTSRKIRELCGGVEGTVVLQDLEGVVADVEEFDGVVKMAHDFFAEQPVKGAHIYYLRRILHDWSNDPSVTILKNLAAAMDRDLPSRVVIAEQILPASGVSSQSAYIDMAMMTSTGMERTERQWEELLARAGLRIERVYTASGTPFGAIEAALA
ncbi:hypothetical protein VMCG_02694 [Cytospora schulzeri]|uniref:O-methyltransferase C-terminal domain-containing protein n=1 Tax=Cytospora schulzeri TaxID=448051 RepID=A0A423WZ88_9PEZI|nr:hypothetical protein VMCG_02694 [Valsa malicola]